jgi:hypothetical protein
MMAYVQQMMMTFAKLDLLSIDWLWADNYEFAETGAHNSKFELSGMETKNFLFNSGSLLPNCFGGILSSAVFAFWVVYMLKHQGGRWVSLLTKKLVAPPMKLAVIQLLYQFTTDAVICSLLQFRAYGELGFAAFSIYPMEFLNLSLSIILITACLGVSIFSIGLIQTTGDLEAKEFQLAYSTFVSGLKVDRKVTA